MASYDLGGTPSSLLISVSRVLLEHGHPSPPPCLFWGMAACGQQWPKGCCPLKPTQLLSEPKGSVWVCIPTWHPLHCPQEAHVRLRGPLAGLSEEADLGVGSGRTSRAAGPPVHYRPGLGCFSKAMPAAGAEGSFPGVTAAPMQLSNCLCLQSREFLDSRMLAMGSHVLLLSLSFPTWKRVPIQ